MGLLWPGTYFYELGFFLGEIKLSDFVCLFFLSFLSNHTNFFVEKNVVGLLWPGTYFYELGFFLGEIKLSDFVCLFFVSFLSYHTIFFVETNVSSSMLVQTVSLMDLN